MKKHPIIYIRSYGFKLWLIQVIILFLNKFKIFISLRKNLVKVKNELIYLKFDKEYQYLIDKYKSKKVKNIKSNKVWVLWWQGEEHMPEIVKKCVESIKENLIENEVIVLSQDNINKYISLPENIQKKYDDKIIGNAHFSDIIRVNLLKEYGGIWIDATILITKKVKLNELNNIKTIKFDCNDKTSISKGMWCGFLLGKINPILYEFMYEFYLDYWTKEDIIIDYFLMDFIIKLAYDNFEDVKTDIDNNKNNNQDIHILCKKLNDIYEEKYYNELLKSNFIHKLSYKVSLQEFNNGEKTYWNIIKNGGKYGR